MVPSIRVSRCLRAGGGRSERQAIATVHPVGKLGPCPGAPEAPPSCQRKRWGDCRRQGTRLVESAQIAQGRGRRLGMAGQRLARPLHRMRPGRKSGRQERGHIPGAARTRRRPGTHSAMAGGSAGITPGRISLRHLRRTALELLSKRPSYLHAIPLRRGKVREHSRAEVPVLLVVGRREAEQRQVAVPPGRCWRWASVCLPWLAKPNRRTRRAGRTRQ